MKLFFLLSISASFYFVVSKIGYGVYQNINFVSQFFKDFRTFISCKSLTHVKELESYSNASVK